MASATHRILIASALLTIGGLVVPLSLSTPSVATAATATSAPPTSGSGVGAAVCVQTASGKEFTPGASLQACDGVGGSLPAGPGSVWKLAWSDEFDGNAVDTRKWNVLNNSTYGEGNLELACLTNRPANVRVGDGALTISAQRESGFRCGSNDKRFPNGRSFSSGHLETKGKASFKYGRFEVRAKSPTSHGDSKGMWPAFWMRPVDGGIGEIDILENIGTDPGEKDLSRRTNQTIHYDYVRTHPKQGTHHDLPAGRLSDGFHEYAVEWEPGAMRWYVDDVLTWERNLKTTPWLDEAFARQFYLRLNLAVGGNWPGSPSAETRFPNAFVIDYVRVYQRS